MNDSLMDTIGDQVLAPSAAAAATPPTETLADQFLVHPAEPMRTLEELLAPDNPADGLLSSADWLVVAQELRLSVRERTVATLIFEGNTRFQIARRLNCADSTVRVYIDRVFAKLKVVDRLGMVLRVLRVHTVLAQSMSQPSVSVVSRSTQSCSSHPERHCSILDCPSRSEPKGR